MNVSEELREEQCEDEEWAEDKNARTRCEQTQVREYEDENARTRIKIYDDKN